MSFMCPVNWFPQHVGRKEFQNSIALILVLVYLDQKASFKGKGGGESFFFVSCCT